MTTSSGGAYWSRAWHVRHGEHALTDGWAAAALVATGVGCAAMGIVTAAGAASPRIAAAMNWYNPVGPLSGKTLLASIIYFASWLVLARAFYGQNVRLRAVMVVTWTLIGIGLLLTFPPVFELFAKH